VRKFVSSFFPSIFRPYFIEFLLLYTFYFLLLKNFAQNYRMQMVYEVAKQQFLKILLFCHLDRHCRDAKFCVSTGKPSQQKQRTVNHIAAKFHKKRHINSKKAITTTKKGVETQNFASLRQSAIICPTKISKNSIKK
jgi:hypothetical protein